VDLISHQAVCLAVQPDSCVLIRRLYQVEDTNFIQAMDHLLNRVRIGHEKKEGIEKLPELLPSEYFLLATRGRSTGCKPRHVRGRLGLDPIVNGSRKFVDAGCAAVQGEGCGAESFLVEPRDL
jgi:hypothetical protein